MMSLPEKNGFCFHVSCRPAVSSATENEAYERLVCKERAAQRRQVRAWFPRVALGVKEWARDLTEVGNYVVC